MRLCVLCETLVFFVVKTNHNGYKGGTKTTKFEMKSPILFLGVSVFGGLCYLLIRLQALNALVGIGNMVMPGRR